MKKYLIEDIFYIICIIAFFFVVGCLAKLFWIYAPTPLKEVFDNAAGYIGR